MSNKIKIGISSNALKRVAMISMVCDHIGYKLIEHGILRGYDLSKNTIQLLADPSVRKYFLLDAVLRGIGRIGYQIFAYLIVISFLKTRNVYKYLMRMLVFAILSEVPFDLFWADSVMNFGHQNVLFTYLLGLLAILSIDRLWKKGMLFKILSIGTVMLCIAAGFVLRVDYNAVGVLVVVLCYVLRNYPLYRDVSIVVALTIQYILDAVSCFSIIFIRLCNGEYRRPKRFRYFFYWFYPVHMLILILLEKILY